MLWLIIGPLCIRQTSSTTQHQLHRLVTKHFGSQHINIFPNSAKNELFSFEKWTHQGIWDVTKSSNNVDSSVLLPQDYSPMWPYQQQNLSKQGKYKIHTLRLAHAQAVSRECWVDSAEWLWQVIVSLESRQNLFPRYKHLLSPGCPWWQMAGREGTRECSYTQTQ